MPVLLEDLYTPAARLAYHVVRQWELGVLERPTYWTSSLVEQTRLLARSVRQYLFLVQRLRHLASDAEGTSTRFAALHHDRVRDAWARYTLTWESDVLVALDQLVDAFKTLERGHSPCRVEDVAALSAGVEALRLELDGRVGAMRGFLASLDLAREHSTQLPAH